MELKNSWLFPVIQSVHLAGIALLVGTIVLVDLRLLGYALGRYSISEISHRFARWTRAGLAIMLTTDPVLFVSDVTRYSRNPAFLFKIAVLGERWRFTLQRTSESSVAGNSWLWFRLRFGLASYLADER